MKTLYLTIMSCPPTVRASASPSSALITLTVAIASILNNDPNTTTQCHKTCQLGKKAVKFLLFINMPPHTTYPAPEQNKKKVNLVEKQSCVVLWVLGNLNLNLELHSVLNQAKRNRFHQKSSVYHPSSPGAQSIKISMPFCFCFYCCRLLLMNQTHSGR